MLMGSGEGYFYYVSVQNGHSRGHKGLLVPIFPG
uniref:Uncharacterized protein n=1 Tax=Anguilla anguilla TaxID=7936 RepID=A0A0E9RWW4_ANGAN